MIQSFPWLFLSVNCKAVDDIIEAHSALDRACEAKAAFLAKFDTSFVCFLTVFVAFVSLKYFN